MSLRNALIAGVAAFSMGVLPAVAHAENAAGTGTIAGQVSTQEKDGAILAFGALGPLLAAVGAIVIVGAAVAIGAGGNNTPSTTGP